MARAGRAAKEIAKNEMKEVIMSKPAISDGVMVVRTLGACTGSGRGSVWAGTAETAPLNHSRTRR